MDLIEILEMDSVREYENCKVHESVFQSYHIVDFVYNMARRGDSSETIVQVINLIRILEREKYKVNPSYEKIK
jgi:hypothetical protein